MKAAILISAFLAVLAPQKGTIHVSVDAKNGETVSGERTFRVTVESSNPVNYVEFYVNNELRDKQTSTPYKFVLDAVDEAEGAENLTFKAYTAEGEQGKADVKVRIDNGLSKGADSHVQTGTDALHNSKWDDAVAQGRIALKIDPKNTPARLLLSRAYFGENNTGKAQKYAQDILDTDPKNREALNLSSAVNLKIAFKTYVPEGGDMKEALGTISEALKGAVTARRQVLDNDVDALGPASTANALPLADAALHAYRYSLAIPILRGAFDRDHGSSAIGNRLAFAYLKMGRYPDAVEAITSVQKYGQPDAYTDAVLAVLDAELGDMSGMDKAISDALLADPDAPVVADAQAYIALKFIRPNIAGMQSLDLFFDDLTSGPYRAAAAQSKSTLQKLLGVLEGAQGNDTVTFFYRAALDNKLADFGPGHVAFEDAVLAEPANSDAYIEEGNRALTSTQTSDIQDKTERDHELATAETMYQTALLARADSAQALTGLALVSTIRGDFGNAIKWGEAAVAANPEYASGQLALGTAYSLGAAQLSRAADATRQKTQSGGDTELEARKYEAQARTYARAAKTAGDKAGKLDKRLVGQELVKPYMAWRYFRSGGRVPVLPQPPK